MLPARSPVSSLTPSNEVKKMPKITGITGLKGKRSWYLRKDPGFAAPSLWKTYVSNKPLLPIRPLIRGEPPMLQITPRWNVREPEILSNGLSFAQELQTFWKTHGFELEQKLIFSLLQDSNTIVLGIRTPEGDLCATAASRVVNGPIISSSIKFPMPVRSLDGFVIAPELRSRGLASWLFAWLDKMTQEKANQAVVHIAQIFEHQMKLPSLTIRPACVLHHYSITKENSKKLYDRHRLSEAHELQWTTLWTLFQELQEDKPTDFDLAHFPTTNPVGVSWWRVDVPKHPGFCAVIGVKDTGRKAKHSKCNEFLVVFTCYARTRPGSIRDLHYPSWETEDIDCMELPLISVAQTIGSGSLCVSDSSTRGSMHINDWKPFWERRIDLNLSYYVYNTMLPTMGNASVLWPSTTLL